MPNLFLAGAPKAGTTTVANWLSQHSEIFVSRPKEPTYWATDFSGVSSRWGFAEYDDYLSLFANPESRRSRYRVDASTYYFYSETALSRIVDEIPEAKFIFCLRYPVNQVRSYHWQQVLSGYESERDFARAWSNSLRRERGSSGPLSERERIIDYVSVARLGSRLAEVIRIIPPRHWSVLVMEEFAQDPASAWTEIQRFLGVGLEDVDLSSHLNSGDRQPRAAAIASLLSSSHDLPRPLASLRRAVWASDTASVRLLKQAWRRSAYRTRRTGREESPPELVALGHEEADLAETVLGREIPAWRDLWSD